MKRTIKPLKATAVVTFKEIDWSIYQFNFLLPRHKIDGLSLCIDYRLPSPGERSKLYEELLAKCLKSLKYRVYSVLWLKSRYRELFEIANEIYGYGNHKIFKEYLNILNVIGFGEDRRKAKRIFYADLEGIILFIARSEKGQKTRRKTRKRNQRIRRKRKRHSLQTIHKLPHERALHNKTSTKTSTPITKHTLNLIPLPVYRSGAPRPGFEPGFWRVTAAHSRGCRLFYIPY